MTTNIPFRDLYFTKSRQFIVLHIADSSHTLVFICMWGLHSSALFFKISFLFYVFHLKLLEFFESVSVYCVFWSSNSFFNTNCFQNFQMLFLINWALLFHLGKSSASLFLQILLVVLLLRQKSKTLNENSCYSTRHGHRS